MRKRFMEYFDAAVVADSADADFTTFEALAQIADKKNKNNRIYPRKVLEAALERAKSRIDQGSVFALVDHPEFFSAPSVAKIGAVVKEVAMDEYGKVYIKGTFTDGAGKAIKDVIRAGGRVGISARGHGSADYDEKTKTETIKDDYEIDGWDFVVDPAVVRARITKYESVNSEDIDESSSIEDNKTREATTMEFKTLEELRAHYPQLFVALDASISEQNEKLEKATDEIAKLTNEVSVKSNDYVELKQKYDEVNGKLLVIDAEIAKSKRESFIAAALKDNKFAEFITVPVDVTDEAKIKEFVESETARCAAILDKLAPKPIDPPTPPAPPAPEKLDATKLTEVKEETPAATPAHDANKPESTKEKSVWDMCIDEWRALATRNVTK